MTRERKGYGKLNLEKIIKDDTDEEFRTRRNLKERCLIEKEIFLMNTKELSQTLSFIKNRILKPVVSHLTWYVAKFRHWKEQTKYDSFGKEFVIRPPPVRQWIAMLRIQWLGGIFKKRVNHILSSEPTQSKISSNEHMRGILVALKSMKFNLMFEPDFAELMQHLQSHQGGSLYLALLGEISEEMLSKASKDLLFPYSNTLWCALASRLTRQVMKTLASTVICASPVESIHDNLAKTLLSLASSHAIDVINFCIALQTSDSPPHSKSEALEMLSFCKSNVGHPSITRPYIMTQHRSGHFPNSNLLYEDSLTAHSEGIGQTIGEAESLEKFHVYQDRIEAEKNSPVDDSSMRKPYSHEIVGIPRNIDSGRHHCVNDDWYLLWQVLFVVHSLTTNFLKWDTLADINFCVDEFFKSYSLEKLCDAIGVNFLSAQSIFDLDFKRPLGIK